MVVMEQHRAFFPCDNIIGIGNFFRCIPFFFKASHRHTLWTRPLRSIRVVFVCICILTDHTALHARGYNFCLNLTHFAGRREICYHCRLSFFLLEEGFRFVRNTGSHWLSWCCFGCWQIPYHRVWALLSFLFIIDRHDRGKGKRKEGGLG